MRVIYWTELFWPHIGGVEIFSKQLISALQKRGHEIVVITSRSEQASAGEDMVDGIKIYRLPFQQAIIRRDLKPVHEITEQVLALFRQSRPHLVHINSSQPSIFFYHLARTAYTIPTIFTIHEPPAVNINGANSLAIRTMQAADWVVAVSQATLDQARQLAPEINARSSLIYNGLEMPSLPVTSLPFDPPSLLCMGRLIPEKGFDIAIRSLHIIHEVFPSLHLVIAGEGQSRGQLEMLVEELGLGNSVEFIGWCAPENIPGLINAATIVLMPSRWQEPFGLVALQAAQMGRPVIASQTGGLPEVVADNETGLLFEKENSTKLARQVVNLLQHPEIAIQLGSSARKRAQQKFGMEEAAAAYDALYQQFG